MKTRAKEETIIKYFEVLKELHSVLNITPKISMHEFCKKKEISRNLGTVLKDGGVIRLEGIKRHSKWYWNTTEPTREMAIETIKRLSNANPERIKKPKEIKENINLIESMTFKLFWIKITIKINYKNEN